jgi:hypothetical protein
MGAKMGLGADGCFEPQYTIVAGLAKTQKMEFFGARLQESNMALAAPCKTHIKGRLY